MEQELQEQDDRVSMSSTEVEEQLPEQTMPPELSHLGTQNKEEETKDGGTPISWKEEREL